MRIKLHFVLAFAPLNFRTVEGVVLSNLQISAPFWQERTVSILSGLAAALGLAQRYSCCGLPDRLGCESESCSSARMTWDTSSSWLRRSAMTLAMSTRLTPHNPRKL